MTREEAVRKLQKQKAEYLEEWVDFSGVAEAYDMAIEALTQPEIIRCKDCKYNLCPPERGNACCDNFYGMTDQMGFCHYGERRTDGR